MLGETVKAERKRRGWTQQELAHRSGLAQGYWTLLENGKRANPGVDTLQKLGRAFDLTVDQLLAGTANSEQAFPAETLRTAGLPDAEIARISALWEQYPDKRSGLLESAHTLAQAHAKLERIAAGLHPPDTDI